MFQRTGECSIMATSKEMESVESLASIWIAADIRTILLHAVGTVPSAAGVSGTDSEFEAITNRIAKSANHFDHSRHLSPPRFVFKLLSPISTEIHVPSPDSVPH